MQAGRKYVKEVANTVVASAIQEESIIPLGREGGA